MGAQGKGKEKEKEEREIANTSEIDREKPQDGLRFPFFYFDAPRHFFSTLAEIILVTDTLIILTLELHIATLN